MPLFSFLWFQELFLELLLSAQAWDSPSGLLSRGVLPYGLALFPEAGEGMVTWRDILVPADPCALPLGVSEAASSLWTRLRSGAHSAPLSTLIAHRGFLKGQAVPSHQPQVTKNKAEAQTE